MRQTGGSPTLSDALEAIRAKYDLPALGGAAFGGGRLVESAVVGRRKFDDPTPAQLTDTFHLGSCTKSMTATLTAMAIDDGKLRWETTLAELFPEQAAAMQPAFRTVTVHQLMTQESGFSGETWPTGSPDWRRVGGSLAAKRARYVQLALLDKPVNTPGTTFQYANRNYIVLGAILERLTGMAWEALVAARLFQPLGMKSAGFGGMATPPDRVDEPWPHVMRGGKKVAIAPGPGADNPAALGPAGTVHCSIGDWATYGLFHLRAAQGRSDKPRPQTARELYEPPAGSDYACGWATTSRPWGGGRVLTHNGSNTMNFAVMWLAPLRDFGVLAVTNQGNNGADSACDDVAATLIRRHG